MTGIPILGITPYVWMTVVRSDSYEVLTLLDLVHEWAAGRASYAGRGW